MCVCMAMSPRGNYGRFISAEGETQKDFISKANTDLTRVVESDTHTKVEAGNQSTV